jgi:hypothetical protein
VGLSELFPADPSYTGYAHDQVRIRACQALISPYLSGWVFLM